MQKIMAYFTKELAPDLRTLQHQQSNGPETTVSPIAVITQCVKDVVEIARSIGKKDLVCIIKDFCL